LDTRHLSDVLTDLKSQAEQFFSTAYADCGEETTPSWMLRNDGASAYWDQLTKETRALSQQTQETLLNAITLLLPAIKASPVLDSSDEKDTGQCVKRMRASLRLRNYKSWNIEVLADEDRVLGVNPPGQSDDEANAPAEAKKTFFNCAEQLEGMVQLLRISPTSIPDGFAEKNPNLSQAYRPNTAFIMMPINGDDPDNEDVCDAYKECFLQFGIVAIRADDIEHEDIITKKIIEQIKTSEFLVGDLSHERPSVYYEIGYAHSLGRRVIMYRKAGTKIHFDLAAYNCREYKNKKELKSLLLKRLEDATNRKPENG
jgi:hypothetical protein